MNRLSRRTIIAGGAAAALPVPSLAGLTNPVFAAIEQHRTAAAAWSDDMDDEKLNDAMDNAAIDLVGTTPTTIAGAAAALRYYVDHVDGAGGVPWAFPYDILLWTKDDAPEKLGDQRSTEYFLMRSVANALAAIDGGAAS